MRYFLPLLILSLYGHLLYGQGAVGSWSDHLPYSTSYSVAAGGGKIYSSAGQSVLELDLSSGIPARLSKVSGLNETGISTLGWSEEEKTLVIVYKNTGVDLVKKGVITNIPDIRNKYIPGLKEIYSVYALGNKALLSGSFGIVVIDLTGRYITDTWRPGPDGDYNPVYETVVIDDVIYAATARGIYTAPVQKAGLSFYGNWELCSLLNAPGDRYSMIIADNTSLYACKPGENTVDSLFRITPGTGTDLLLTLPGGTTRSIDIISGGIAVAGETSVYMLSESGVINREISGYGWATCNPGKTLYSGGTLWISDSSVGLVSTSNFTEFKNYTLPGPYTNNVADIVFNGNSCLITGGTVDNVWGNVFRPFQLFECKNDEWYSRILYGSSDRDAMRVAVDPENSNHYFVSAWGNGLYEFSDGNMTNNYNQYNSPLTSIIPGDAYSRLCGLAFDREGNLWMTQSGVPGNLKILTKEGTWVTTALSLNVPVVGDMIISQNGYIWAILPRGHGLLVYDPGETPASVQDDRYLVWQVEDTDGHVLSNLFSLAEDEEGNIWIGTDQGPAVYYNPSKAFTADFKASRIKIPRDDGTGLADYLLGTETINTIAVDGANRKWLGTMSSGAYLISDDGRSELLHFTSDNSPLLSDNIVKIAVNGVSGDVWFGTSEGIVSFRGDATQGNNDFSGLYVFPNPVRNDYEGVATITGLMEGSTVKITDISGNLVYETVSTGGQATWDLRNYRGERTATGVYLIFCNNEDGTLAGVTKMLIIR